MCQRSEKYREYDPESVCPRTNQSHLHNCAISHSIDTCVSILTQVPQDGKCVFAFGFLLKKTIPVRCNTVRTFRSGLILPNPFCCEAHARLCAMPLWEWTCREECQALIHVTITRQTFSHHLESFNVIGHLFEPQNSQEMSFLSEFCPR